MCFEVIRGQSLPTYIALVHRQLLTPPSGHNSEELLLMANGRVFGSSTPTELLEEEWTGLLCFRNSGRLRAESVNYCLPPTVCRVVDIA